MDTIEYGNIDEAVLIHGLYHGTRPLGMGVIHDRPGLTVDDVRKSPLSKPDQRGVIYIDYLAGRPLKVHIDTKAKTVTARLYDRDAGQGACARVVESLRAKAA